MHTTIDIDDVLAAARTLAAREGKPDERVVSDLLREVLRAKTRGGMAPLQSRERYGFRPIPAGGAILTSDLVNEIRDRLGVRQLRALLDLAA